MNRRLIKVFLLSSLLMIVVSSCKIFRDDEKGSSNSTSSVSIPVMSPSGGTYSSNQTVTISTETAGSTIYYTTDGTTPSSSSTVYSGTITVTHSETINAIATKSGMSNSEVASEEYVINYAKIPTPLISPVSGVYNTNQDITISSSVSDAQIYYTTDGSPPTMFSSLYTGMFTISTTKVVQAIAIKDQMEDSDVASNDYVLKVVKPVMSPSSGSYSIDTEVTISTDTGSSTIYYTTDGTDPSTSSNVYSTPVVVSGHGNNETIKAIAVKDGWSNSEVSSDAYLINYAKVSTPSISPVSETYNNDQDVTIACSTDGAELYYTTDGSSPTSSSTHYTGLFTISANTTVKAIGIKSQMQNSDVAENIYNLTVAAPVITPVS
ncbi:MAG: chitobiase/beta-hexosaminidase C-terminal domain-containing protein, partial [bacterium]